MMIILKDTLMKIMVVLVPNLTNCRLTPGDDDILKKMLMTSMASVQTIFFFKIMVLMMLMAIDILQIT